MMAVAGGAIAASPNRAADANDFAAVLGIDRVSLWRTRKHYGFVL